MDRTTISMKVSAEFAKAVGFFADKENASIADYARSAMIKRAIDSMKDRAQTQDEKKQLVSLMDRAIAEDQWQELAADDDNTFPATLDGWKAKIEENTREADSIEAELLEMQKQIQVLGVSVLM